MSFEFNRVERHCCSNTLVYQKPKMQKGPPAAELRVTAYSWYNIIKIILSCFSRVLTAKIDNKVVYLSTADTVNLYNRVYRPMGPKLNVIEFNALFKSARADLDINTLEITRGSNLLTLLGELNQYDKLNLEDDD